MEGNKQLIIEINGNQFLLTYSRRYKTLGTLRRRILIGKIIHKLISTY